MNQILTDEEITLIIRECARGSAINRDGSTSHRIARAIEQAILNKLSEQEPVCYGNQTALDNMLDDRVAEVAGVRDGWRKTPLYLHPAPSVPEGWTAIHLKTGNEYQVIGEAIDATNMHCNQLMVIYQRDGKTFVREAEEFQEKFKASVSARSK